MAKFDPVGSSAKARMGSVWWIRQWLTVWAQWGFYNETPREGGLAKILASHEHSEHEYEVSEKFCGSANHRNSKHPTRKLHKLNLHMGTFNSTHIHYTDLSFQECQLEFEALSCEISQNCSRVAKGKRGWGENDFCTTSIKFRRKYS